MPTLPLSHPAATRAGRWPLAWIVAMALCLGFAFLAGEYVVSLALNRPPLAGALQGWLVSQDYAYGPRSVHTLMTALYTQALPAMVTHIGLGGAALVFGVTQFVPSLRRRWPRVHRVSGWIAATAIALSMAGAIRFLVFVPVHSGYSGPTFHLGLWALALLTAFALTQAIFAVLSRDFRSHMVWMAITFAAIATAPMLRIDWWLLGHWLATDMERVNLASGGLVLSQTYFLAALWLAQLGDKDLPGTTQATSAWPMHTIRAMAWSAAAVAVHEGVLAPLGLDLLAHWRAASERLPVAAVPWAIATVAVAWFSPRTWSALLEGKRPPVAAAVAGIAAAIGAFAIAASHETVTLIGLAQAVFWFGWGVLALALLALAWTAAPTRLGRNAWGLQWLALLWFAGQWPGVWLIGVAMGASLAEAASAALAVGAGGAAALGIATGFGAQVRLRPAPRRQ